MALLGFLVSGENAPEADLNVKSRDYEPINPSNIDVAANTAWTPPTPKVRVRIGSSGSSPAKNLQAS